MRGLIWHCKSVKWTSKDREDQVNNCLVAFCCFEKKDGINEVSEAARRIKQLNKKRFHEATVVIFPFAHLSSSIMPADEAERLHIQLAQKLKPDFETVEVMPFNKDKDVAIHLLEKNEDVSYFEY